MPKTTTDIFKNFGLTSFLLVIIPIGAHLLCSTDCLFDCSFEANFNIIVLSLGYGILVVSMKETIFLGVMPDHTNVGLVKCLIYILFALVSGIGIILIGYETSLEFNETKKNIAVGMYSLLTVTIAYVVMRLKK